MDHSAKPTFRQRFSHWLLRLRGWRVDLDQPSERKYVLIVAPHTSNWDFPIAYLAKVTLGLNARWLGKHTLFHPPHGWLMKWLGGIPIDRRSRHQISEQLASAFDEADRLIIAITPEGTRRRTEYWKSGFYYIALAARVPIAMAYIDYKHKRMGISQPFIPSGDKEADLQRIRAFYADKTGLRPEKTGIIRFADNGSS